MKDDKRGGKWRFLLPPSSFILASGSPAHASLMLAMITLFWGLSFPLMKNWLNAAKESECPGGEIIAGLTVTGLRTILALLFMALFMPRLFLLPSRREWALGLLLGLTNNLACSLQVWGLAYTSPALSVFFTSLGSAWVPVIAFVCFRITVGRLTLVGLLLGLGGAALLGIRHDSGELVRESGSSVGFLGWGEALTLLSSFVFAVVIIMLDRLGRRVPSGHLSIAFLAGSGLPSLLAAGLWSLFSPAGAAWPRWSLAMLHQPEIQVDLLLLTIFSTVLSMHWMSVYQPRVPASRAALIYLLEPVFGAALSIAWGHDRVTGPLVAGGCLILGGNLLVELPMWLRERKLARRPPDLR